MNTHPDPATAFSPVLALRILSTSRHMDHPEDRLGKVNAQLASLFFSPVLTNTLLSFEPFGARFILLQRHNCQTARRRGLDSEYV